MILSVEDDEAMAENCSMFLETKGFHVCVACSGAEARAEISRNLPELVISDCALPGMSGVELMACLKDNPATAGLPIVMMGASLRCDAAAGSNDDAFLDAKRCFVLARGTESRVKFALTIARLMPHRRRDER